MPNTRPTATPASSPPRSWSSATKSCRAGPRTRTSAISPNTSPISASTSRKSASSPTRRPTSSPRSNALRARYTYVFTTGGIGPTHDDITADTVAKAFGVAIGYHPEAVALMQKRVAETGGVMNEARMRMTRVPAGAELVLNKVSAAPGFWIGNVIVMAGVPHIMQVMLDYVAPKLKTGAKMLSDIGARRLPRRRYRHRARRDRQEASRRDHRLLSVHGRSAAAIPTWWCARAMRKSSRLRKPRSRRCCTRVRAELAAGQA